MMIFQRLLTDRSAATAVEYGILAAMISIALVSGLYAFSDALDVTFATVGDAMTGAKAAAQ